MTSETLPGRQRPGLGARKCPSELATDDPGWNPGEVSRKAVRLQATVTYSTWSPPPAGQNGLTKPFPILPAAPPAFFMLSRFRLILILGHSYVGHRGRGGEFKCGTTHPVLVPRVSLPSVPRLSESWDQAQQKPRRSCSSQIDERPWEDVHVSYHNTQVVRKLTSSRQRQLRSRRYPGSSCRGARGTAGPYDVRLYPPSVGLLPDPACRLPRTRGHWPSASGLDSPRDVCAGRESARS